VTENTARYRVWFAGIALLGLVAGMTWFAWQRDPADGAARERDSPDFGSLVDFLGSPADGRYARVVPGREFGFPADHGAHPDYRQEWWYFTGRLETPAGRVFGYQLTFFRFAGGPDDPPDSIWAARQTWMAHLALTDVAGGRFLRQEDFARGVLGLADARGAPFSVWVNGWSVRADTDDPDCPDHQELRGCFSADLSADGDDFALSLRLHATRPPVLQGDGGYSVKTADGRAASYYYSMPGIATRGSVTLEGETFEVRGESWMDREWSSAVLTPGQGGWDWFSLNLDDGHRLVVFQVRENDSSAHRSAVLLDPEQRRLPLDPAAITLTPVAYWRSEETGSRYPVRWRLESGGDDGWSLTLSPLVEAQEMALAFRYYEGLVSVSGTRAGQPVGGWGYMELTGYGDP
jgi:predicted secreted hydrolase